MPSILDSIRNSLNRRSATLTLGRFGSFAAKPYSYDRISQDVYRGNPTGYRCVEAIKNNFSRPEWQIKRPGTTKVIENDPLLKVLNQPDKFMSGTIMQTTMAQDLELTGKSFWIKVGTDAFGLGTLKGLRRLPAERMTVLGNQDDELIGFMYADRNGQQIPFMADQLLYLRYPHPDRQHDGLPPALVAMMGATVDSVASQFNYTLLANDGGVPGYLSVEGLSHDQFEEFKAGWEQGENPGKLRFLGGKTTFTRVGLSNEEMSFKDLRRFAQRDIMTSFGCPRAVIFDAGEVTFANADSEREMFIQQNILPKWTLVADEMTLQLGGGTKHIGFDLSVIEELARAEKELIERYSKLLDRRVVTVNEFRQILRRPAVEWGNLPIPGVSPMSPEAGAPVEEDPPQTPGPPNPEPEDRLQGGKALQQFFSRLSFVLEKSLSNGKKPQGWWDEKRWNNELADILGDEDAKRVNEETAVGIAQIIDSKPTLAQAVPVIKAYLAQRAQEVQYAAAA